MNTKDLSRIETGRMCPVFLISGAMFRLSSNILWHCKKMITEMFSCHLIPLILLGGCREIGYCVFMSPERLALKSWQTKRPRAIPLPLFEKLANKASLCHLYATSAIIVIFGIIKSILGI